MLYNHKGLFSLYNIGIGTFFAIGLVLVVIFVNIGFQVNDSQKQVVEHAYDEVREQLELSGKISAVTDVSANKIITTSIPVRTSSEGPVNMDPQSLSISYRLFQHTDVMINYDNIYAGILNKKNYRTLSDAILDAHTNGIIEKNVFDDEQKPDSTRAFVYWIINQNQDNFVDKDELAVIVLVYGVNERPATGEKMQIEVNTPEGFVLRIDESVPDISNRVLNFGGIIGGR